ncbi:hypothetical protein CRG98_027106, partial [Punica granatum]
SKDRSGFRVFRVHRILWRTGSRFSFGAALNDLLGVIIQASNQSTNTISAKDIVEECKGFFFAGKQTTLNLLNWAVIQLPVHPQWQHLDVRCSKCVGERETPAKDDLVKLKTLGMTVNEVLRLYPPLVVTFREAKVGTELGSYKIPRGWCQTEAINLRRITASVNFACIMAKGYQAKFSHDTSKVNTCNNPSEI